MESLVHYQKLLIRVHLAHTLGSEGQKAELTVSCLTLLEKLQQIDPSRKRRYQELGLYTTEWWIIYILILCTSIGEQLN